MIGDGESCVQPRGPSVSYLKYSTPFEYLVKMLGDDFFEDMTPGTNTYAEKGFFTLYNMIHCNYNILPYIYYAIY